MSQIDQPRERDLVTSVRRGFLCRCPACGEGRLFGRFLKVEPACTECGQAFHHHRADDFPPYIVMFLVGHIVGYGIYATETHVENVPLLLHAILWPSLAVILSLALLQPVKGAVIGLQYALRMHGFGTENARSRGEIEGERGSWREAEGLVPERGPRAPLA
jgi:uncharacterized protein (DUF983 family)